MANISLNPGVEFYYVGGDFTEGSIANSVAEVELLDYNIPADTVLHGIIIIAACSNLVRLVATQTIFRIKAGTDGAEVEIDRGTFRNDLYNYVTRGHVIAAIDSLDWTAAQTVSITAQMDGSNVNDISYGEYVVIMGF